MSDTVDLFRQIALALNLTPGELKAFASLAHARRAEIRRDAERFNIPGLVGDQTTRPQAYRPDNQGTNRPLNVPSASNTTKRALSPQCPPGVP